jgi:hypothetical protein
MGPSDLCRRSSKTRQTLESNGAEPWDALVPPMVRSGQSLTHVPGEARQHDTDRREEGERRYQQRGVVRCGPAAPDAGPGHLVNVLARVARLGRCRQRQERHRPILQETECIDVVDRRQRSFPLLIDRGATGSGEAATHAPDLHMICTEKSRGMCLCYRSTALRAQERSAATTSAASPWCQGRPAQLGRDAPQYRRAGV